MREGSTITFWLSSNFLTVASSNSEDYKPGVSLRGFTLRCEKGGVTREYAFALRTDPIFVMGN